VIAAALENNRDLRVAALNIEKARAEYRITDADRYPAISATGTSSASRTPAELSTSGRATTPAERDGGHQRLRAGFLRPPEEPLRCSAGNLPVPVETRRSTHISLVAEVATAWLTLASDRER
jgi:multidrug efflux system outer membrane protein